MALLMTMMQVAQLMRHMATVMIRPRTMPHCAKPSGSATMVVPIMVLMMEEIVLSDDCVWLSSLPPSTKREAGRSAEGGRRNWLSARIRTRSRFVAGERGDTCCMLVRMAS